MKIKILGSGGGEGYPASFCSCDHCEEARRVGGKSLRSLSQTLVNDDLIIDFPTDTDMHCLAFGINLGKIENALITHTHCDHFLPIIANGRGGINAHNLKYEKFYFYGPDKMEEVYDKLIAVYGENQSCRKNLVFVPFGFLESKQVGKYKVTALRANHYVTHNSLNYIIEEGDKKLLYLVDTGYPFDETFEYFKKNGYVFDCVVMDATMGYSPAYSYVFHMGFDENKQLKEDLINRGFATAKTHFIADHITHNKAETHEKIEQIFENTGIEVAYDGMEIEI